MNRRDVETEITEALTKLHADCLPFSLPASATDSASWYVTGDGPHFILVNCVSDKILDETAVDGEELVYLAMSKLTVRMARDAEEETRKQAGGAKGIWARLTGKTAFGAGYDDYSRKTWMDGHVRLMGALHQRWGARIALQYDEMLRKYPLTPKEKANTRNLDLTAFGVD